jgi:tetratricopeptide (TPR) repeat protein
MVELGTQRKILILDVVKMMKVYTIVIFLAAALGVMAGCGGKTPRADQSVDGTPPYKSIPGVDSVVVVQAFEMTESLFVTTEEEEEAEKFLEEGKQEFASSDTLYSLKKILDLAADSTIQVTSDDSAKAIEHLNQAYGSYQEADSLFERYREDPSRADLGDRIVDHLEKARASIVRSIKSNPFDMDARLLLSIVYRYLARVMGDEQNFENAARVLEELIRMDEGEPSLHYELAYNYFNVRRWGDALSHFERAEELLHESSTVDFDAHESTAVDTTLLLSYVWYQGECLTRLYRATEAVDTYRRAIALSKGEEDRSTIAERIEWIEWDGGNIRNVEVRDSLYRVESAGNYSTARSGYLDLLSGLSAPSAIDEIDWKIATIDYVNIGEKERGIERLKDVLDRAAARGALDMEGRVKDGGSLYPTYLENYGTMCFNLGIDHLNQKKRKEAFAYFLQSSQVNWPNRGSSFVELLKLARNNPGMTIEYGEKALENNLTPEERTFVLKQLVTAYKRKGSHQDFEKARLYFNEWKTLTE